jgi:dipeptidyl aminopeptidase/acylaminoacyl peptidase
MKKILFALLCIPATLSAQKRNLVPNDILKIKSTGGGVISPDGNWFLYSLTTIDSAKNNRNTNLWMMSWDGAENIQLTNSPDAETNGKWSPDGKYISFVASRSGGSSQVWLLNRLGGEAAKLTDLKGELSDYAWSPDGKMIALTQKDAEDTSKENKNKPWVIDRFHFKQDVAGYLYDKRKTHIYLFNVKEKKLDTLTTGNYDETNIQWSPDGSKLAFVSNHTEDPGRNENADIFVIDAKPGSAARQLTSWKGADNSPRWSPDGKTIAYLRSTADGNFIMYDESILCTVPVDGGEPTLVSKDLDRPVGNPRWNKDGSEIAVLVSDDCRRYIATYNIVSGKMNKIIGGDRVFNSLELNPNGSWLTTMSDPQTPQEFYALENGSIRRLTKVQDEFIHAVNLSTVQQVVTTSKDGTKISNLLFLPPERTDGKKLPAIFFIHGGPVGQDEFGFDLTRQILSANGYAVVAVNYRGSSGRGIAFSKSIEADWGNKEVMDVLGAADDLTKEGIIDGDKLGIGGWSYGAITTNYTIASDTRFKAACSGAGSGLQLSLVGVDQYINQFENEIGWPWKGNNIEKYIRLSYPYFQSEKIKTPTLFLAGEKDFNVPAVGSEQMYQALKINGVPTELIIYPGQFHGLTNPAYLKDRLERYNNWYDKYIKKKPF